MKFSWDLQKEQINKRKHKLDFSFAAPVFNGPFVTIGYDRYENDEHRYHAFGMIQSQILLLVVHSYPDDQDEDWIRVISIRRATPEERRQYERIRNASHR